MNDLLYITSWIRKSKIFGIRRSERWSEKQQFKKKWKVSWNKVFQVRFQVKWNVEWTDIYQKRWKVATASLAWRRSVTQMHRRVRGQNKRFELMYENAARRNVVNWLFYNVNFDIVTHRQPISKLLRMSWERFQRWDARDKQLEPQSIQFHHTMHILQLSEKLVNNLQVCGWARETYLGRAVIHRVWNLSLLLLYGHKKLLNITLGDLRWMNSSARSSAIRTHTFEYNALFDFRASLIRRAIGSRNEGMERKETTELVIV